MQTYSHVILTAALIKPVAAQTAKRPGRWPKVRPGAALLGSFLPDLPLILLSFVTIGRDLTTGAFGQIDFATLEPGAPTPAEWLEVSMTMRLFDVWFFENPWVITLHNLFHSPLLVAFYIALAYWLWRRKVKGSDWFFWLACAAMLHTLLDIPLHTTDGPLLLFPLNWTWRYASPISYWDPQYYGREWSAFEHTLDAILLVYLGWTYWRPASEWLRARFGRGGDTTVEETAG